MPVTAAPLDMPAPDGLIETPRLRLRPNQPGDAEPLARLVDNWNVARWLAEVPFPYSAEMGHEWVARSAVCWAEGSQYHFSITRRDDRRLIGQLGLKLAHDGGSAELGYWLGQAYWGRGYAGEATAAAAEFAFRRLGLGCLLATSLPDNEASLGVLARLGFRRVGTHWESFVARQERIPVPLHRLDARDWFMGRLAAENDAGRGFGQP